MDVVLTTKNDKIMFVGLIVIASIILIFATNESSLVFLLFNQYAPAVWDEVLERNIVRSSIPIEIISKENNDCMVTAKNFDKIIDHQYFVYSNELAEKLKYDRISETLSVSCDILKGDKSRLNVWFVVEESKTHSNKYEYFVTPWEDISRAEEMAINSDT